MKSESLGAAVALALCGAAFAQAPAAPHAAHRPAGPSAAAAATPLSDGEVRKVDKAQSKVTLRHGPIAHLDMPAMTMVFRVDDPKMLDAIKPGDKVRFAVDKVDGALIVTLIEVAN